MAFNQLLLQEIVNNALIYKDKEIKVIFIKVKFQFRSKEFEHVRPSRGHWELLLGATKVGIIILSKPKNLPQEKYIQF